MMISTHDSQHGRGSECQNAYFFYLILLPEP